MLVLTNPDAVPNDDDADADAGPRATAHADSPMLTPWACGLIDEVGAGDPDRCVDIIPELMVELI
jgi:hypothetical protein